ncbi:MAG TPA: hypothetical protein VLF66_09530, partial [Thermoanaerobaculia bacterium]|nr:hypothetical protein [Thermoanaerobaculia bacterium]
SPAGALGMRRTFWADGQTELRTDGTRHPLRGLRFYAVDRDGRVFRGNGDGLDGAPPGAEPGLERRLAGLFRAFEERLEAGPSPAELDPEAVRTLRALGYMD